MGQNRSWNWSEENTAPSVNTGGSVKKRLTPLVYMRGKETKWRLL